MASEKYYFNLSKNYYDLLGVKHNASQKDIKQAFLVKSKELHPDKNPKGHAEFLKIQEAYNTIGKPGSRSAYDRRFNPSTFNVKAANKVRRRQGPLHAYDPKGKVYTDADEAERLRNLQKEYGRPFPYSGRCDPNNIFMEDPKLFEFPKKVIRLFENKTSKIMAGIFVLIGGFLIMDIWAYTRKIQEENRTNPDKIKIELQLQQKQKEHAEFQEKWGKFVMHK